MYRSDLKTRDKGGAIAAVIAIHAVLLFVFMHLSGRMDLADPQRVLQVFDITEVPPPPPPTPEAPRPAEQTQKAKEPEGAASPENIRSQATPVVAPRPPIELPVPLPVNASQTPNEGAAPTQGASNLPGPGTGAGGTGTGTGSGASGSGSGGGGDGIATRAQLLTPSLRSRDFPPELRRRLSDGASPFVIFTVQPNGRVTGCHIYQSSGDPAVDDMTCRLVSARFVYRPAYNRRGEPVSSQMAYRQAN
jgi:periplasmic protein TonB